MPTSNYGDELDEEVFGENLPSIILAYSAYSRILSLISMQFNLTVGWILLLRSIGENAEQSRRRRCRHHQAEGEWLLYCRCNYIPPPLLRGVWRGLIFSVCPFRHSQDTSQSQRI